jgi:D-alanyl-lipoteichoic acid acyltransferase DltB (MBOAT superfamily)
VAWGMYHGLILVLFRLIDFRDPKPGKSLPQTLWWLFCVFVMFHLTCFGWMLFRAETFSAVIEMCQRFTQGLPLTGFAKSVLPLMAFYYVPLFLIEFFTNGENSIQKITRAAWYFQVLIYAYFFFMTLLFQSEGNNGFIYFQF